MKWGKCKGCGCPANVNWSDGKKAIAVAGNYCAWCWDRLDLANAPARGKRLGSTSGPNHNDHSFDNAVRAIEDR